MLYFVPTKGLKSLKEAGGGPILRLVCLENSAVIFELL